MISNLDQYDGQSIEEVFEEYMDNILPSDEDGMADIDEDQIIVESNLKRQPPGNSQ